MPGQQDGPPWSCDTICEMRFAKGEPVPNWMEDTSHSGVFEVDALCALGSPARMLERFPGLLQGERLHPPDCERLIALSPAVPLMPGQALLRYAGANVSKRPFNGRDSRKYGWIRVIVTGGETVRGRFFDSNGDDYVRGALLRAVASRADAHLHRWSWRAE